MQSVIDEARLDTPGKRVTYRRLALGLDLEYVAIAIGLSRVGLSKIENDEVKNPRAKTIFSLAKELKCRAEWIVLGTGPIEQEEIYKNQCTEKAEFFVPRLALEQTVDWQNVLDSISDIERVVCPIPCSPSTFATTVNDTAMLPWMAPNDIVFIDPQQKDPHDEEIVLVKLMPSEAVGFRKVETIGGERYLVALNESYPPHIKFLSLVENPHIIGTVQCILRSGRLNASTL